MIKTDTFSIKKNTKHKHCTKNQNTNDKYFNHSTTRCEIY